jgi:hypothetical protein
LRRATAYQIAVLLGLLAGCGADPAETPPPAGPPLSVCEAGRKPLGSTIIVRGEFDGFGYEANSRRTTLGTSELCSDRGAGSVVANLANASEAAKLADVQPRDRRRRIPGGSVSVSGRISKIEDGRFVHLDNGVVRQVER